MAQSNEYRIRMMPDTQPRTKSEVVFEDARQKLAVAISALKGAGLGFAIAGADKSYQRRMISLILIMSPRRSLFPVVVHCSSDPER